MSKPKPLNKADIGMLKNILSGDGLPTFVDFQVAAYFREAPPERDKVVDDWCEQSLTQAWAWDALMALLKRVHDHNEPRLPTLVRFAVEVALCKREDPRKRSGRPKRGMGRDFRILAAVHALVEHYDYSQPKAREKVHDLLREMDSERDMDPDTIRKTITDRLNKDTPFFRPNSGRK